MNALWQLSATDLAAMIRARQVSAREAAQAALARLDAVNPAINAVVQHRPGEVLARADAVDAAFKRGEDHGAAGGRAGHRQDQCRPGRFCHQQWRHPAARPHRQRPTARWSTICESGCGDRRAHQRPAFSFAGSPPTKSMATPKIRATPALPPAARPAAPGRRSPPVSGISATAPNRRIDPLSRLCLRRV